MTPAPSLRVSGVEDSQRGASVKPFFLALLAPDPRSRDVRRDLHDCNGLHRTIMRLFPDAPAPDTAVADTAVGTGGGGARSDFGVLYRLEQSRDGGLRLLVQAGTKPDFGRLPNGYEVSPGVCKAVDVTCLGLATGQRLRFRLRANPSRAIDTKTGPDGKKNNGRRVEVKGEEACQAWLRRKGEQHGFRVIASRLDAGPPDPRCGGGKVEGRKAGATITIASVLFEGVLEVTDGLLLQAAVRGGIGRGKSYGQGLLSLARVPEECGPGE